MIDWQAVAAVATVVLAVVTAGLAGATVWLGLQTRDVSQATGRLATRTGDELDLIRQQVDLQRQALRTAERERHESRRPTLAWSSQGSRSERFTGRLLYVTELLLKNHGQIAFVERIEVKSHTADLEGPSEHVYRQQLGPTDGVTFALRVWAYDGDQTAHHTLKLIGYARSIVPGARLEEFPVLIEIAAGTGGLTIQPLDPDEAV